MTREVLTVPPELTLDVAWQIMTRQRIRHLPVVRAGALIGMLSDRDILRRGSLHKDGSLHVPNNVVVGEAMTPPPLETCESSTQVSDLARMMVAKKIDAVPVVRGLHLIGLVTTTDLLELLIDREEARPLPFDFRLLDASSSYA